MDNNVKGLSELLAERAKDKLVGEIRNFVQTIRNSPFFSSIGRVEIKKENGGTYLDNFFWHNNSSCEKMIIEDKLPEYIENETRAFMEKIENVEQEIANLRGE